MNRTTFLQDVYSVVAAIPEGCVVTYGQIASLVGRPQCSRMVGQGCKQPGQISAGLDGAKSIVGE